MNNFLTGLTFYLLIKLCSDKMKNQKNISLAHDHVAMGFNFPPSQYQLHLQYIVLPLLPFQYEMYLKGNHFTYQRFIPYIYVEQVLNKLIQLQTTIDNIEVELPELLANIEKVTGISYDTIYHEYYEHIGVMNREVAHYQPESFEKIQIADKIYNFTVDGDTITLGDEDNSVPSQTLIAADKVTLQSYGKPTQENGKPAGTYYGFIKTPEEVISWI